MVTTAAHATPITVAAITAGSPLASGQLGYNTNVTGWTNNFVSGTTFGYNFVYASNAAALAGANGYDGLMALDPSTVADPGGTGPYFALDGDYESSAVSTTLSGLTVGATVTVSFDWAATQQLFSATSSNGGCPQCTGASTDQLAVSLGASTDDTGILSVTSQGFNGWHDTSVTFIATSSSEVLSFLDLATPQTPQVPAFALLDNVSASQNTTPTVPEPNSLLLLSTGLLGLGGYIRMRSKSSTATKA
jgi:hypothetical protein